MENDKNRKTISIVVPCYNEEENIGSTYAKLKEVIKEIKKYYFEIIFIDNGSQDKSRLLIKRIAQKDKKVIGIFLSRNFGPEASLWAGVIYSKGSAVIALECDLQSPPSLIKNFLKKWESGYELVISRYIKSEEIYFMTFIRKSFYRVFKAISGIDVPINSGGFCLLSKKAVEAMKLLPEKYRFFRGLRAWIGFKTAYVTYERRKRLKGKSSYNFFDYIKHAERGLFGFSYLVLDLMVYGGFILVFFSFAFFLAYLFTVLVIGNPIKASIPLMLAIVFFGGVQLLAISIIGKYIQVIVEETKGRPVYIVEETINI